MKSWRQMGDDLAAAEVGQKIAKQRKVRGWSVLQLAQISGVSHETIRRYERGETFPQLDSVMKIAATLQVSVEELLPDDYRERFRARGLVVLEGKVEALRRGLLSNAPSSDESNSEEKASYLKRENSIDRIAA